MAGWGRNKPPLGTQINWGHDLAEGINVCYLCNDGAGSVVQELVTGRTVNLTSPTWNEGAFGNTSVSSGSANSGTKAAKSSGSLPISVLCWYNTLKSVSTTNFNLGGMSQGGTLRAGFQYKPSTSVLTGIITDTLSNKTTATATLSQDFLWRQAVIVATSITNISLYVNGVFSSSNTTTAATNFNNVANSYIGGWVGNLDHLVCWNRALSTEEILWLYEKPFAFMQYPLPQKVYLFGSVGGNTYNYTMSGGVLGAGSATVQADYNISGSSGGGAGGTGGGNGTYNPGITGGSYGNGSGVVLATYLIVGTAGAWANSSASVFADYFIVGTGGAWLNGLASVYAVYNISGQSGGSASGSGGGNGIYNPGITGGAYANGTANYYKLVVWVPTGGAWANGSGVVWADYFVLPASGGQTSGSGGSQGIYNPSILPAGVWANGVAVVAYLKNEPPSAIWLVPESGVVWTVPESGLVWIATEGGTVWIAD